MTVPIRAEFALQAHPREREILKVADVLDYVVLNTGRGFVEEVFW
jgi:hypothetical protein